MKTKQRLQHIPQYEFPFAAESFNLFSETADDGARVAGEQAETARLQADAEAAQASLFPKPKSPLQLASPYRLRKGDIIRYEDQTCPVLRVTDCAAVIAMEQPAREFTTIFGKQVRIQPKPRLIRISSNSAVPILNHRAA